MAPRKRSHPGSEPADVDLKPPVKPKTSPVATTTTTRVTRSSARLALQGLPDPEPVARVKPNKKKAAVKGGGKVPKAEEKPVVVPPLAEKTVVIEHCKQCNSFKTRALQVKNGLETGVCGIIVLVNPEKPRRGCFEIREEGGKKFISLLDMKRPFSPMKALDMEVVISDIVGELNAE